MATPTPQEIADSAKSAAKDILDSGMAAYTHGNKSRTHLDPLKLLQAAREGEAMDRTDEYGITTLADMRTNR
jgi:hypothetical protein